MIDKLKLVVAAAIIVAGLAAFYYLEEQSVLLRTGIVIASVIAAGAVAMFSTPGQMAWEFAKDARMEVRKVVWPTRRETVQGTLMVLLLVILVGIYLWLVDRLIFMAVYDFVLGTTG